MEFCLRAFDTNAKSSINDIQAFEALRMLGNPRPLSSEYRTDLQSRHERLTGIDLKPKVELWV
jgi:hypothetical protein